MKVAVVDNYTHLAPLGRGWIEGLTKTRDISAQRVLAGSEIPEDVDLVVITDNHATVNVIDTWIPRDDVKTIVNLSYEPYFDVARAAGVIDLFVSHTLRDTKLDASLRAYNRSVLHVPFGARELHFSSPRPEGPLRYDVAFIGSAWHGPRGTDIYLDPLIKAGLRVFKAGLSDTNYIPYVDTRMIYEISAVCINFHYPHQKNAERTELNARTFDLALMGACQVIDHLPQGYEGLATQADPEYWVERVKMLVDDPELRAAQKALAAKTALSHTWSDRMRPILKAVMEAECKPICT